MLEKAAFHRRLPCPFCTAKFPAPASLTRSRRYSKTSRRAAAIADDSPGPNRHFGERYKCTTQASEAYLFGPDCHSGTRIKAGPSFWIKESFSLADLYAADIQVHDLGVNGDPRLEGRASVWFHIRNFEKKIQPNGSTGVRVFSRVPIQPHRTAQKEPAKSRSSTPPSRSSRLPCGPARRPIHCRSVQQPAKARIGTLTRGEIGSWRSGASVTECDATFY